MRPVDYDLVADGYGRRYETNQFDGIDKCLRDFLRGAAGGRVAEIGCGTGHWLRVAGSVADLLFVAGLDLSAAMLTRASLQAPGAALVRGTAHELPWADASFDRVLCINALHHFVHRDACLRECARVLRPGCGFLTIGLDPHAERDRWWIYDYFPAAIVADRERYPATEVIRDELSAAGFQSAVTTVAQHLTARPSFAEAEARGLLERTSTSQLMVISDDDWARGMTRLRNERPEFRADLRLYATTAWRS